jgi:SAM-dependent methyltransferase
MADHRLSGEAETEMLERILTTATATEFRNFVCDAVAPRHGESVLSVGCGPGFETAVLAQQVGERGSVTGVDVNDDVLATAKDRCRDLPQVSFTHGDVTALPVQADRYDLAIAKQVLQFVDDVDSALAELFRVLEPGGRVAVIEVDRDTQVIHSSDPERMRRASEVYRAGRGNRHLGTRLVSLLPGAGFTVEEVVTRARTHTEIDDQVERGIEVQRDFLESSDEFDRSDVDAWEQDLRDLDDAGQFLSCATTFLYVGNVS